MLVDLLIIVVVIISIARNWHGGFVRQFWPTVGFFGGLLLGRALEPLTLKLVHSSASRSLIIVITLFGLALIGLSLGEYLGVKMKHRWLASKFNPIDNALGSLLTTASVLFGAWIIAAIVVSLPASGLKTAINQSAILRGLNQLLPPAPKLLADVGHLIDPNGFPDVFIGSEPIPRSNVNLPSLGELASAVQMDENSVVRIQGLGCGGLVSGSGFVVGQNLVATNAHVVAGISRPVVEDVNGRHAATVIWFDPSLDFAVLSVNGLAGGPLSLDTAAEPVGTPAAVLGYPGGGSFNANPAAILDEFEARGQDIYGNGETLRSVYEIQANVIPGNSGGPLVNKGGQVIGVVFAASTTYNHVGYALTMSKVASETKSASSSTTPVSTGQCAN